MLDVVRRRLACICTQRARNLLLAFGSIMDDAFRQRPEEQDFIVTGWDRAERLLPRLFQAITADASDSLMQEMDGSAKGPGLSRSGSCLTLNMIERPRL
jgi:hypothetical protein